ncbi:polyprenyl synthetase family protein [Streptomyces sp. NK15101]|uniref:polyprenyl synthetase family protein n=1 Tax=Streptomyces sp. NK15101 TaxID=2873261 RepID=UPI001CEDD81C|nr:polyprenyl synthetase family protein [Streptomyces sp. NK15101]
MHVLDPSDVDQNVPAAVRKWLGGTLERRLEEAEAADPVFAADIAGRVARFALDGGRRLRSAFLWWAMRGCGGGAREAPRALGVAAALELIQTCALIHDDVMDGSTLRRGRPAVHVGIDRQYGTAGRASPCGTFGGAAAVLAGDLALAWADDAFAEAVRGAPAERRAADVWRVMRMQMVAGQYLDLHGQVTRATSANRAVHTAVLKTALYTVGQPLALGAVLAGAPEHTVGRLRAAGWSAGLAFQLHDDLQGAFGDPATTGKPSGEDIREGRATYLLAVARELCLRDGDHVGLRLLDEVLGAPAVRAGEADGGTPAVRAGEADRGAPAARAVDVDRVLELLETCGARDLVSRRVEELCARGVEAVADAGLSREATDRLGDLLRDACGRSPAPGRPARPGAVRHAAHTADPAVVAVTDDSTDTVLIGEAR